jgi:hypothetical protein
MDAHVQGGIRKFVVRNSTFPGSQTALLRVDVINQLPTDPSHRNGKRKKNGEAIKNRKI